MGEPQNAAAVLGDLDRHALADPAEPVELVVCQLLEIPNRRFRHVRGLLMKGGIESLSAGNRQVRSF